MIKAGNKPNLCQKATKPLKYTYRIKATISCHLPSYHFGIYKLSKW